MTKKEEMGGSSQGNVSAKPERKTVERRRRLHMKSLCLKLASLVPKDPSRSLRRLVSVDGQELINEMLPQANLSKRDLFEEATNYVKKLQKRIEGLNNAKKEVAAARIFNDTSSGSTSMVVLSEYSIAFPKVEVRETNSVLEVVLMDHELRPKCKFAMSEVVRVLEEEGAQIVLAQYSTLPSDKLVLLMTIHAKPTVSRLGLEGESVHRKLKQLLQAS